jgi:DNA-binding LytR/AlgR family response regulator
MKKEDSVKIKILENQPVVETEIEIRCQKVDEAVTRLLSFLNNGIQKINAYQGNKLCLIDPKDVYYFESVDKKTFVYLEKSVLETPLKLYEVMECGFHRSYFRASKSGIINIDKIKSAIPLLNGNLMIELFNREKVLISRRYVSDFNHIIGLK